MTRDALAAELFDVHQRMKDAMQSIIVANTAMGRRWPHSPFPPEVSEQIRRLTALVKRAETAVANYMATEPGPVTSQK
jgi:hypothetical protein